MQVTIDDREILDAFGRLVRAAVNPRPALSSIGEYMLRATEERFAGEHDPDGVRWTPLSPATLYAWMGGAKSRTKRGGASARASARAAGKKILTGETHNLRKIVYQVYPQEVLVGSDQKYAAIHQFGGKAGRGRKVTIPARPFLGVNARDGEEIVNIVHDYLRRAVG